MNLLYIHIFFSVPGLSGFGKRRFTDTFSDYCVFFHWNKIVKKRTDANCWVLWYWLVFTFSLWGFIGHNPIKRNAIRAGKRDSNSSEWKFRVKWLEYLSRFSFWCLFGATASLWWRRKFNFCFYRTDQQQCGFKSTIDCRSNETISVLMKYTFLEAFLSSHHAKVLNFL